MLIALTALAGRHAFAPDAIACLARALRNLVFGMLIGFAHSTGFFPCFFGGIQLHARGIARKIAIGSVIFFAFGRRINGLTIALCGQAKEKEKGYYNDFFHDVNFDLADGQVHLFFKQKKHYRFLKNQLAR